MNPLTFAEKDRIARKALLVDTPMSDMWRRVLTAVNGKSRVVEFIGGARVESSLEIGVAE